MNDKPLSAKAITQKLAAEHNIQHSITVLDRLGETFSRLSDSGTHLDDTEWLLVKLERADIITGPEATRLQIQHRLETAQNV